MSNDLDEEDIWEIWGRLTKNLNSEFLSWQVNWIANKLNSYLHIARELLREFLGYLLWAKNPANFS